ncbi:Bardet-Biedl syndrome 2 protein homolog [Venturia canescens]|uniref:Bardet-Biedl syndrome 2 protein homolog n=1 Tax=Venturia canescens TaxID=32260 RepID=UPI001C9D18C0|nr:Bardet-Biedl syndrome 2 protein homolog [Venturia canescens]
MAAFSLNLQRKVEQSLVSCGKFDGSHACLVASTSSGNVLVHSPHRQPTSNMGSETGQEQLEGRLAWSGELAELQIGRQVTALCTGRLIEDERDILLIGTLTHVLAYQVEENADLFYKEMSDGAHCLAIGKVGWLPKLVAVIGGNCSVTVLDSEGVELFWTVMGDVVKSLTIFDFDGDGENELITGTDDFEIKVLKNDVVLWETKETAPVTGLVALPERQFAYVVGNGTVGIYESGQRLWRIKSKHRVVAVRSFDVNGDGAMELLTGWSSGKVDARSCLTGEVIFRIQLSAGIAGLVEADYRRTGRPDLVIVSVSGEVRGYAVGTPMESPEPGEAMRNLLAKKQALQVELRQRKAPFPSGYMGTKLAVSLFAARGAARLALAAGPGLLVHCAIVFAEGVFDGETLVSHPGKPTGELEIELRPPKNGVVDIHVKVCVGASGADLLQVYEVTRQLPRFCMYEVIPRPENPAILPSDCGVVFEIAERPQRVALWLNQSLLLVDDLEIAEEGPKAGLIEIWLRCLRDYSVHCFRSSNAGRASVQTQDPEFAGDVVQSLAGYLGLREMSSEARFPEVERKLTEALEKVKGLREVETRFQADTAGGSALLKNLIVRLEDARILEDVETMKRRVEQLKIVNGDLLREHEIRMNSSKELIAALKELNVGVRHASRLRVGRASANAINRCRSAIQDENPKALVLAIRNG